MKLEILSEKSTYSEALGMTTEDWTILRKKIEDDCIEHSKNKKGMNCMDLLLELSDKYAENPTEVGVIGLIIGEIYIIGYPIERLLKYKIELEMKMGKPGLDRLLDLF